MPPIRLLRERFAVCRLPQQATWPSAPAQSMLYSVTRTSEELSIVCEEHLAPAEAQVEPGWRAFQVLGPLPFQLTGIMAEISAALASQSISLFAFSTFDTDYILVKEENISRAKAALQVEGQ